MKNIPELVRKQQDVAFKLLERGHEIWGLGEQEGFRPDAGMIDMYAKDYSHLMAFAQFVNDGKYGDALQRARRMDTAVRDYIIDDLWELVTNYQN